MVYHFLCSPGPVLVRTALPNQYEWITASVDPCPQFLWDYDPFKV